MAMGRGRPPAGGGAVRFTPPSFPIYAPDFTRKVTLVNYRKG
jgi:hypothetical protein